MSTPTVPYHTHLSVLPGNSRQEGTRPSFTEKEPREVKELVQKCTVTNGGPGVWPVCRARARLSSPHAASSGTSHLTHQP